MDISAFSWKHKNIDSSKFNRYKDEDIIFVIQRQFIEYSSMFYYNCKFCKNKYEYKDFEFNLTRLNEPLLCKTCGNQLVKTIDDIVENNFIPGNREDFNSIWMDVLVKRYIKKLCTYCKKHGEHAEDKFQDYLMAFYRAVLSYNTSEFSGKTKFNSYFWKVVHNESCDDNRDKSSIKKNPSIMCMVCGKKTGKITAEHLMNYSEKFEGSHDFMGHKKFIEYIESMYEDQVKDLPLKLKKTFIRKKALNEYQHCFPGSPTVGLNVSLDDQISFNDEELCRRDTIACDRTDPIIFDDGFVVFDEMVFSDDDVKYLMENFPQIYYSAVSQKKLSGISRKFDDFETKYTIDNAITEMLQHVINDYCHSERGITRKALFYDEENHIKNIGIIYDIIDLYSHDYNLETITSFVGHDNMEKEDLKIILRILGTNEQCKMIAEEHFVV